MFYSLINIKSGFNIFVFFIFYFLYTLRKMCKTTDNWYL